ncbi:fatty acid hydroxylase family protein [Leptospira fluminis]|uniref:Fatty acid hydroxylase family protein n=1 Tax=Leptospira fluminis TaxID=2484979 RepID=A0A4R9GLC8_9LEPT|nr:sterol desaturase family protein [Leptospira fluminis]TGK15543.1 fatty acid hydroxylase family protein [Leptospira fluminis]
MAQSGEMILKLLKEMTFLEAFFLFLMENLAISLLSILFGNVFVRLYPSRRVSILPPPVDSKEVLWVSSTLLLNTAVTLAGLFLWRNGFIVFRNVWGISVLIDVLILFFVMDALMYILHRVAHISWIYPFVHKTHHLYENPRPLTLFVLNPFEALGFGALWLLVLCVYDSSWIGMSIYLILNVVFGTLGHLGVEPFSDFWIRIPVLRLFATSTFHAQHHIRPSYNFGFYTLIWDRLFRTLSPDYEEYFGKISLEREEEKKYFLRNSGK